MLGVGMRLELISFNMVLKTLANRADLARCEALFREMMMMAITPCHYTYSAMVMAASNSRDMQKAEQYVKFMHEQLDGVGAECDGDGVGNEECAENGDRDTLVNGDGDPVMVYGALMRGYALLKDPANCQKV